MRRTSKSTSLTKMSCEQLADATAEFDKEFVVDTFESPSPTAARRWQAARRERGRPVRGRGAKVISVTVEECLLAKSDKLAKKLGVSRAALIARGLNAVLAAEKAK
ncbi:MAG: hypothetical protein V3W34_13490 [Phycisphaerae bacterium]